MDTRPTSAGTEIFVRVLAFARVREIVGSSEIERHLEAGCTIERLWQAFVAEQPELSAFSSSIRFACNSRIVEPSVILSDGDEVAFLPPVGGG